MDMFTIPVMIALTATIIVLFVGVISMARGGEFDQRHAEHLMFARVSLQAIAIILIIAAALYAANVA